MFIGKIKSGIRKLFLSYHFKVLQIGSRNMRAILNTIEAAYQAVRSTGSKRIVSTICIAERLDASRTLEDDVESVNEMLPKNPCKRNRKNIRRYSQSDIGFYFSPA